MQRHIPTIARFTMLEALRTRLPLLAAGVLAFVWAGSLFIHQIAITESDRLQWSFYAASARVASVFMLALHITSSMVRELNEKGLELVLALDLPRSSYLLGKLLGFLALAAAIALLAGLPLTTAVPLQVAGVWAASLFLELAIVSALSLFSIVTLSQMLPAISLIVAFYLLARSITAIRLMAETVLPGPVAAAGSLVNWGVEALALLVPALDRFAATEWVGAAAVDADVLAPLVLQSVIYVLLLLAASLFDFYRREI